MPSKSSKHPGKMGSGGPYVAPWTAVVSVVASIHKLGAVQSPSRRARLLEEAADLVLSTDPVGTVLFATDRTVGLLGAPRIVGVLFEDLFQAEDRGNAKRLFETALLQGDAHGELRAAGNRGEPRWIALRLVALRDGSRAEGVDVVGHDITEQRWLLDSLERRNAELRAFLAAAGRIASVIALGPLAREVVGSILELVPHAAAARLWLADDDGDLSLAAANGHFEGPLDVPVAALRSMARTGPLVFASAAEHRSARVSATGSGSVLYVGLSSGDQPLGSLCVEAKPGVDLDLADGALVHAFGGHVTLALASARAHETERRLGLERAAILDHVIDGLIVVSPLGRVERMNPAAERFLGLARGAALGRGLVDVLGAAHGADGRPGPEEDRPIVRALRGETVVGARVGFVRGTEIRMHQVSVAPMRDDAGRLVGAVSIFRDVTAESIRAAELQRYAQALAQLSDVVAILDESGFIADWLGGAQAVLGWSGDQARGQPFGDLVTGPDAEPAREAIAEAIRTGTRLQREVQLSTSDVAARTCLLSITRVTGEDGQPLGSIVVAKDVTDDRDLRERLERAQRLESLGRLAAGVAHEVNNPLAFLTVNLEVLSRSAAAVERGQMDPAAAIREVREIVPDLDEGARRIRDVVRSLSSFSIVGDDRKDIVSLPEIVEEAIAMVRNELRHKATLHLDLATVPPIRGSARRLHQAVLNVLVNATESIAEGAIALDVVRVSVREDAPWVVLEIEDSGRGIPADQIGRIFDPFFTTKRVGAGSGLGLTLTHDIVSTHRGLIDVSSEPGVGTKVIIRLPVAERVSVASPAPVPAETPRARVLVVEDEPALRRSYRRVLGEDFEIVEAGNADDALGILAADPAFDVVLCDLHMPGRSGAALYLEVEARWPKLAGAFLFITGGAFSEETREMASRFEARCLAKPVPAAALVDRIRDHANRR